MIATLLEGAPKGAGVAAPRAEDALLREHVRQETLLPERARQEALLMERVEEEDSFLWLHSRLCVLKGARSLRSQLAVLSWVVQMTSFPSAEKVADTTPLVSPESPTDIHHDELWA